MAFDQSSISDVACARDGAELHVAWTSSAVDGTTFQVYLDNVLSWWGTARAVHLPWPKGRNVTISVATVADDEAETDFSASLPALTRNTRTLSWDGGTFQADDIAGFKVYGSAVAGGAVDYSTVLGDLPAYPGGVVTDGFGMGGFGRGGFGKAATSYSWTTAPLGNGSWTFAVKAYDTAGNAVGSPSTVTFTVDAAPRPPAANGSGARLTYTYDATSHVATLNWLASPG